MDRPEMSTHGSDAQHHPPQGTISPIHEHPYEKKAGKGYSSDVLTEDESRHSSRQSEGLQVLDPLEDDAGGIKYKTLKWWHCGMLMIAETISLGILSLPSTLSIIGLIPGIIVLIGLGILSTYSAYVIGQFKDRYPWVHNFADAFGILFKAIGWERFGKELGGAFQTIFLLFAMASHIVTWNICMSTITNHATCNIVWGIVALILFWALDLPRTLKNASYFSVASFISIISAVVVTMIAVGIDKPGTGNNAYTLWPRPGVSFHAAFSAVSNIVFAYAGHAAFFTFISEMKDPKEFPKALAFLQVTDITMYVIVAVVIYRYAGSVVDSPALGTASPLVAKIAYGLAIPTIVIAGVIYGHVCAKYIYVRYFTGSHLMSQRSLKAWGLWAGITGALWVVAWIIAESIPNFNDLLSLIAALLASWMTYGISGILWLYINHGKYLKTKSKMFLFGVNVGLILIGASICVIGLYASIYALTHSTDNQGGSWSCGSLKKVGVGLDYNATGIENV